MKKRKTIRKPLRLSELETEIVRNAMYYALVHDNGESALGFDLNSKEDRRALKIAKKLGDRIDAFEKKYY